MSQPGFHEFQTLEKDLAGEKLKSCSYRIPGGMFRKRSLLEEVGFLGGTAFLLVLVLILFGWLSGSIYKHTQDYAEQKALVKSLSEGAVDTEAFLRIAERKASLKPDDPELQMALANLYFLMAEANLGGGDSQAFYLEAAESSEKAWVALSKRQPEVLIEIKPGSPAFNLRFQQANILSQAGREREAAEIFSELVDVSKGEQTYQHANLLNSLAWLLATAEDREVRDPELAHRLSVECIKLLPEASQNAVFLDTLAMTYYLKGDYGQAVVVQKEALARADSGELQVLTKNFDLFTEAAANNHAD